MGLLGGVAAGGAYTCLRQLGIYNLDGAFIVLVFSAFSCCASLPFILAGFTPMTAEQVLIMAGAGIGAAIGQFGITAAYRFSAPGPVAVFDYTNIIFTAVLGFMFFGQIPDLWSILGYVAIVVAAVVMRKKG
jgi:drug/metabolite transporter (DMT)-like permease